MNDKLFTDALKIQDKLFRFAYRLLGNLLDAQDVTQDVYEKLLYKKPLLQHYDSLEALAMKMVKDMCFDRLKMLKNRRDKLDEFTNVLEVSEITYEHKDLAQITLKLMCALPEKQKLVIHLRDVEGYEFEEIVQITDMDINAIRMNLSRARKVIREQVIKTLNHGL